MLDQEISLRKRLAIGHYDHQNVMHEDHPPQNESHRSLVLIRKGIEAISALPDASLEMNLQGLDWDKISSGTSRTPVDCLIQWTVNDHPLINKEPWTSTELSALKEAVSAHLHQFSSDNENLFKMVATFLNTNRSAIDCFIQYQQHLNPTLIKRFIFLLK